MLCLDLLMAQDPLLGTDTVVEGVSIMIESSFFLIVLGFGIEIDR